MRLSEALRIIAQPAGDRQRNVHLLCGFTPLHLETLIKAHLRLRFPEDDTVVRTGLFEDLEGNIQRAAASGAGSGAIVPIEWSDLDRRLGFRAAAGWTLPVLDDIVAQVEEKCRRLDAHFAELAGAMPVVVLAPSLGLPPFTHVPPAETSAWELRLNAILIQFLNRILDRGGIRVVSATSLERRSPLAGRHDLKMDLLAGFPYSLPHADAVAELALDCLFPAVPRKGIITDLDETLWSGILGDVGPDGVSWSLEDKSQAHALYQQVLASLADSGVLVAIASKNDPALADAALHRHDILLSAERIFPVEAGWDPKSAAVGRILEAWNIGPESVVFVDDSPMELAEVAEKYPGIECLRFPSGDPAAILALLWHLRARFGKSDVREEDRLRLASLRASAALRQESSGEAPADFLSRLEAKVTFEAVPADAADQRALELVNKTNQFNLNGARYTEAEWKALGARTGAFLATVSYEDRFGPLGRIAVLGGHLDAGLCCVDIWVMSCRAFSRQIEFQTIRRLFDKTGASAIRFRFRPTERNGPLQSFFTDSLHGASSGEGEVELEASMFDRLCPQLFHQVNDKWTLPKTN